MERPVHQCPCPDCQVGTGPIADHHRRLNLILHRLDEQQRRYVAAAEALRLGYGGFNTVAAITGMHPETIRRGRRTWGRHRRRHTEAEKVDSSHSGSHVAQVEETPP